MITHQLITAFLQWKYSNFHQYFIEVYSHGSNLQFISIDSDNGLALKRLQAIILTNGGLFYWRIYALLDLNSLFLPRWVLTEFRKKPCSELSHNDVIKWKHFPRYCPLCGEFTSHWWIPLTKASDAELWCFLWFAPEQKVE